MTLRRSAALCLAAALLLAGACGDDDDAQVATTTTGQSTTTAPTAAGSTTTSPAPADSSVDWAAPANSRLPGGWSLADAAGDGPFIAARRDGVVAGQIENLAFKVSTIAPISNALEAGDDDQEALAAHIDELYAGLRSDRAKGCGAGYLLQTDDPVFTSAPDGVVARYGFTGRAKVGAPAERTVVFAGLRAGNLVLVSLAGSDAGTCVPVETGFASAAVDALAGALAPAVTRSGLPRNVTPG